MSFLLEGFFEWFKNPKCTKEHFVDFFLQKFCTGVNTGKKLVNHIFRPSGSTVTLPAGGISMPLVFPGSEI